jgi:hypothetical protein
MNAWAETLIFRAGCGRLNSFTPLLSSMMILEVRTPDVAATFTHAQPSGPYTVTSRWSRDRVQRQ